MTQAMVKAKRLLADLKRLRKQIENDLRQHHQASPGRAAVEAEWRTAFDAKRTADTFETFWSAALDQAAVHWILGLVFLRFLEDNRLVDRPLLSGPGERLELAELRQREFFRARPQDSDAEYLLDTFDQAAKLPGLAGLYDPAHNPLFRLPVSGDGAMTLLGFFRARVPETGALLHDFTDPEWNTRFLGDLYQDLSEEARKRYALLQTPDFVEDWILSRTLDPAIREFGYEHVRMIDPACGSGHFLLGGFARILAEWQHHAPDMPPAAQAQKALDAVAGVDLNPFAVEIARFRLLLAALRAAEETRLAAAPDFRMNLAVGDSLFHGTQFFRGEIGGAAEGFRRRLQHHYVAEDTTSLDKLLGRQYHAVVGNPPYITPKDPAMRDAYREIYRSCHMKYSLGVPFIERFFDLAQASSNGHAAGFVGLIVANSFMKREAGAKSGSRRRWTSTSLPWLPAGVALRRCGANTAPARPSSHVGFKSAPAALVSPPQKCRSPKQKRLYIAGKPFTVGWSSGSRHPTPPMGRYGLRWIRGSTPWRRTCSQTAGSTLPTPQLFSRQPRS
jgi:SAM-dependent methyltransferase